MRRSFNFKQIFKKLFVIGGLIAAVFLIYDQLNFRTVDSNDAISSIKSDVEIPNYSDGSQIPDYMQGANQVPVDLIIEDYNPRRFVKESVKYYPICGFGKSGCPFTKRAKELFAKFQFYPEPFFYDLDLMPHFEENFDYLKKVTNIQTVPNIFIGGKSRGGCTDMEELGDDLPAHVYRWTRGKVRLLADLSEEELRSMKQAEQEAEMEAAEAAVANNEQDE